MTIKHGSLELSLTAEEIRHFQLEQPQGVRAFMDALDIDEHAIGFEADEKAVL